ncbi:uncharacterized protein LOC115407244 [Salarias fasciatus]|uniref:uncharacterized protein LOC115407244 n=1 Tax=Salarias fasciatus TaxID=181472 RepID=UPI001176D160|nr:uncharacterized protein LOC115407244 [Salarias fasciatus]
MPAKKTQRRKPEADWPGTADESVDIPENPDTPPGEDKAASQRKKRVRVSKREIPDYRWTEEAELKLAEMVKENPLLYDRKEKDWQNVAAKSSRWDRVGEQLEPPATGPQCKKHYDNMRTRVGKILKKSRAGRPQRSLRDHQIMETWSFLQQHIVRGETVHSEQFPVSEDDEVRSTGSHSPTSTATGKGKRKRSRTSTTAEVPLSDLSDALRMILARADSLGASHSCTAPTPLLHQKIVHDFSCLLEGHMQDIPEESWHEFQIDCLNLVHRYKQQRQLFQQPQRRARSMRGRPGPRCPQAQQLLGTSRGAVGASRQVEQRLHQR